MTVRVTVCVILCMASETVAVDEMVWPLVGMKEKTIGLVRVSIASEYLLLMDHRNDLWREIILTAG